MNLTDFCSIIDRDRRYLPSESTRAIQKQEHQILYDEIFFLIPSSYNVRIETIYYTRY